MQNNTHGDVAELADALDLGSSSFTGVQVRFLSSPFRIAERSAYRKATRDLIVTNPSSSPRSRSIPKPFRRYRDRSKLATIVGRLLRTVCSLRPIHFKLFA